MGLFKPNYNAEGPGVSKDEKQKPGIIRFFSVIGHRFWQITILNAIYLFACLPIITIGPATAGMTYVLRNFSQSKHADFFSDFKDKAKENFGKSLLVIVFDAIIAVIVGYSYMFWSSSSLDVSSIVRTIALVCVFFFGYLTIATNFYLFPMMVSFDLPLKKLIKNSAILALYKIGPTLAMMLFNAAIVIACVLLFPLSLPVIVFLAPSICCLFNNFMVYPLLVKYVATKKDENSENEDEQVFHD